MPTRSVKSHVVGPAVQPDGARTTAYRARASLPCQRCGAEIAAGALFSRHAPLVRPGRGLSLIRMPICQTCCPVQLEQRHAAPTEEGPRG